MPSVEQLEEIRANYFAEDVAIEDAMRDWTVAEAEVFFDSGGAIRPGQGVPTPQGVFALSGRKIDGTNMEMRDFAGKPLLIMNVASR